MSQSSASPAPLQIYFGLIASARKASTQNELQFLICNDSRGLVPFRQAMLFLPDLRGKWQLATHSGLSQLSEASPYQVWLEALITWQHARAASSTVIRVTDLPEALQSSSLSE